MRNTGKDGEGSKVGQARTRTAEYPDGTMYVGGTPTTPECAVVEEWNRSDQRKLMMPFQCCDTWQEFLPRVSQAGVKSEIPGPGLKFRCDDAGEVTEIGYECGNPACKRWMLETARKPTRNQVKIPIPVYEVRDAFNNRELLGLRETGTPNQLMTLEGERDRILRSMNDHVVVTRDYQRCKGWLEGKILDDDGTVVVDLFARLGEQQIVEEWDTTAAGFDIEETLIEAKVDTEDEMGSYTTDAASIAANATAITAAQAALATLTGKVNADEATAAALATTVGNLQSAQTATQALDAAQAADLTSLKASRTTDEAAISANATAITALQNARVTDQAAVATIQAAITSLQTSRTAERVREGQPHPGVSRLQAHPR